MTPTIFACVRTGTLYPVEYVYRLHNAVKRFLPDAEFTCLTDRPQDLHGFWVSDISKYGLHSWWGKMALFEPSWREGYRVVFLDLDMVVVGDLQPLIDHAPARPLAICENFTRAAGNLAWPCRYGSCAMVIPPDNYGTMWSRFWPDRELLMNGAGKYGDQKVIEWLEPNADYLQRVLPPNFFLGYRDLPYHPDVKPAGTSVVVFAGKSKPHNAAVKWVRDAWVA